MNDAVTEMIETQIRDLEWELLVNGRTDLQGELDALVARLETLR